MSERTVTCIGCPMGCRLRVTLEGGQVSEVDGAACGRGAAYARQSACARRVRSRRWRVCAGGASPSA
jgi:CxxC motif-containing protein